MTSAFRNLRQMVDNLVSGEDNSSDSDYVSTSRGGKRKASNDLRRPSKSRRYFRPQFAEEDYTTSDFWEGAAERRTSRPTLLGAGVDTLVMDSGTESGHATPEPSNHFSIFNRKITPVRRGSSGKPASPERVRQGRLRFWDKLQKLVGGVEKVAEEADEEGIDQVGLNADLEHAKEDLEHARSKVEEAQAEIEHRGFPQQPIEEYQPSPEPENLPTLTLTAPSSRQNSEDSPWTSAPNARARRIIRHTRTLADAATRIKEELTEPEYAYRDIEIRDTMWQIMDKLECFARVYFGQEIARNKKELEKVFREMEPETVKVIGCVASGGPGGENGWRELFWDERKRGALVCAIIGNVLVEQVFQHACFGADEELLKELREIQEEMQDEDGFARNTAYATHIRRQILSKNRLHLPSNFVLHVSVIVSTITTHINPLLRLFGPPSAPTDILSALTSLVTTAGIVSLQMRLDPHTVYYHTPMFKEDTFQSKYMEAFNKQQMEATHPRQSSTIWPANATEAEKKRAKYDEPLTQITIMDGVTAYRKGGWETKDSSIWDPVYAGKYGGDIGIRARVLVHGWVYCRWGRTRKWAHGKPADDPGVHGMAWKKPGFVEFRVLPGVPDPDGTSQKASAELQRSSRRV